MAERYEIKGRLGRGGVGAVYLAYDHHLQREVAIKRLLPLEQTSLNDSAAASLESEARSLAALSHPNIVTIFEFGEDATGPFVVFEYIEGDTLKTIISEGALSEGDFYEVADQMLDALVAAHQINILHRDIKPANLMLSWLPSGKFRIKILDFGLAKFSRQPSKQTLDQKGSFLGSIDYIAPEQIELGRLDKRTDLYSMGCVLYFALTQRPPFAGESMAETMRRHLDGKAIPLRDLRPDLPQPLCDWVTRLISRDPENRPPDAITALKELERAREQARHLPAEPAEHAKMVVPVVETAHPSNQPVRLEHTQQIVSSEPAPLPSPIPALPPQPVQESPRPAKSRFPPVAWLALSVAGLAAAVFLTQLGSREVSATVQRDQKYKNSGVSSPAIAVPALADLIAFYSAEGPFQGGDGLPIVPGAGGKPSAWENLAPAAHPFHLLLSREEEQRKPGFAANRDGRPALLCRPGNKWSTAPQSFASRPLKSDQFTATLLYRLKGRGSSRLFRLSLRDRENRAHPRAIELSVHPGALLLDSAVSDERAVIPCPPQSGDRYRVTFLEMAGGEVAMWHFHEDPGRRPIDGGQSVALPLSLPASLDSYEAGNLLIEKNAPEETVVELLALTIHSSLLDEKDKRRLAVALFEGVGAAQ